jgi:hypothetical protein
MGQEAEIRIDPRLRNGAKVFALIRELETRAAQFRGDFETTLAVLKDQVDLMMFVASGAAPGEIIRDLRKQSRVRELGLRLRTGDPQAARSMVQRQRALKAVTKMRAAGFPNLQAARAAKAAKAAEGRARHGGS